MIHICNSPVLKSLGIRSSLKCSLLENGWDVMSCIQTVQLEKCPVCQLGHEIILRIDPEIVGFGGGLALPRFGDEKNHKIVAACPNKHGKITLSIPLPSEASWRVVDVRNI